MASDAIPVLVMVLLQLGFAGMNIASKLAMGTGMNPIVLVAYRQIFGALAIAPLAFWLERKARPRFTISIIFHIFLSSLTGATGNQVFYFVGLRNSTPTVACAVNNVLPAITFILAALFRQESVGIKTKRGQAKVIGTIVGISGALVLSFYHGKSIPFGESGIHWKYADQMQQTNSSHSGNYVLGTFFVIASCVSLSTWFIIQTKLSKIFPAPYTSSTCMCLLASIECALVALCFENKLSAWSLRNPMRLVPALYMGIVSTGLSFCLVSWVIQRKGPLFVSVFNPLVLVIVAMLSWALLREKLYVGTVLGSVLIVLGLYAVLWGKKQEISGNKEDMEDMELGTQEETNQVSQTTDVELQLLCGPLGYILRTGLYSYD